MDTGPLRSDIKEECTPNIPAVQLGATIFRLPFEPCHFDDFFRRISVFAQRADRHVLIALCQPAARGVADQAMVVVARRVYRQALQQSVHVGRRANRRHGSPWLFLEDDLYRYRQMIAGRYVFARQNDVAETLRFGFHQALVLSFQASGPAIADAPCISRRRTCGSLCRPVFAFSSDSFLQIPG